MDIGSGPHAGGAVPLLPLKGRTKAFWLQQQLVVSPLEAFGVEGL